MSFPAQSVCHFSYKNEIAHNALPYLWAYLKKSVHMNKKI